MLRFGGGLSGGRSGVLDGRLGEVRVGVRWVLVGQGLILVEVVVALLSEDLPSVLQDVLHLEDFGVSLHDGDQFLTREVLLWDPQCGESVRRS